ncbi:lectin-like [Haliotis rubra]|uniref:lectin-like n=1 Tax=Haliotis rubra TaxID=36100 RepID=UPI001EE5C7B6|nr:lectin-like [Haliotis rubra]
MTNTVLFALTLCLAVCYTSAFLFTNNCGSGCRAGSCAGQFGCTRCQGDLCVKRINRFGVCVPYCGLGAFCNPVGFCNDCDDSNCEICPSKYQCDRCRRGYRVEGGGYCVRERRR